MINSQRSDAEKNKLIEEGKRNCIDEVINHKELLIINKQFKNI